jgi:hypothetical protein
VLRAELARATADSDHKRVHVVEGGKRLAKARHSVEAASLNGSGWRDSWDCARYRIQALGSGDEPFGNLTITVSPDGEVSLRLPRPLEHLANAKHGRFVLSGKAAFSYRGAEWRARITSGQPVSYTIAGKPGRAGRYLTAAWACLPTAFDATCLPSPHGVHADGPVAGVDLNGDHLAVRRLDAHGNPVGRPHRVDLDLSGSSARRDAQVGKRSPGSSTSRWVMASTTSPWKTWTSPMPAPQAGKPWAADDAANDSVRRWPAFRRRCSAAGSPRKPPDMASACSQSTRHTPACGAISTGVRRMRTSPDTRRPPP